MDRKINFRCDEAFESLLYDKMKEAGFQSYSEFIRESIEKTTIKQRCQGIQDLIKEVNRIGVNLNQISRYANENKTIDQSVLTQINNIYARLNILLQKFNNAS